jgi:hypothetical protein
MAGSRGKGGGGRGGGGGGRGGQKNNNNNNNNNNNKITCNNCGKVGHKSDICRAPKKNNQNNQNNQNNKKCPHCNMVNPKHTPDACFKKPGGANGKGKNNTGGGNITRVCSKCKGWHLDRDCNAPANGLGTDGKPLHCKFCQGPHFNNACPTKIGPANWASTNTNTTNTNTDNTNNTSPYFNANTPGGVQNTWNDAKHLSRPCDLCGEPHLDDDCPQAQYLAPGQHSRDGAIPPVPQLQWSKDQHAWIVPPQPPPVTQPFPYQGFGLPPQASAAKYQDDADNIYQPTNIYGTSGISAFAASNLGRNGNEFHKEAWNDRDGDIEMEDVDGCEACEFDPLEQVELMRQREVEREIANLRYQQEMQELARRGDIKGFGWGWKYP